MVYNPEEVTILVDGRTVTGLSEDSKVNIERTGDDITPKVGVQGDVVYELSADRSGTVKFTLFQSSASLTWLRGLAQRRKKVSLTVRNANSDGGFIVSHSDCRILKVPGWSPDATEVSIFVPVLNFKS